MRKSHTHTLSNENHRRRRRSHRRHQCSHILLLRLPIVITKSLKMSAFFSHSSSLSAVEPFQFVGIPRKNKNTQTTQQLFAHVHEFCTRDACANMGVSTFIEAISQFSISISVEKKENNNNNKFRFSCSEIRNFVWRTRNQQKNYMNEFNNTEYAPCGWTRLSKFQDSLFYSLFY